MPKIMKVCWQWTTLLQ